MILVRPDHATDVAAPVRLQHRAAGPEARRLKNDFSASRAKEIVVSSDLPVIPDCVGNVGADMLLLRPAQNRDHDAIGADDLGGRRFEPRIRGLPRIKGAAPAHGGGFLPGAVQGVKAIHERRPRRFRPCPNVKRKQIDFRVPEHVTVIVVAGQSARANRNPVVAWIGSAVKVIDCEP